MHKVSITAILSCLFSVCLFLQGTNAQDCITPKVQACSTNVAEAEASADQGRICSNSAAIAFLKCMNKVITDCNVHLSSSKVIEQAIYSSNLLMSPITCGTNGRDCTPPKLQMCFQDFHTVSDSAGQDDTNLCSAANSYLTCSNNIVTDCSLNPSKSSIVSQAITITKTQLATVGCGASGLVYSIVVIVLGVCLQGLF
ncbi:uncharacterized protein LOC130049536 isoform X2 [Ostrea edulis]|nr:uncharacterized protein LOC130049536 isoform X2 [Ostrea edulis]